MNPRLFQVVEQKELMGMNKDAARDWRTEIGEELLASYLDGVTMLELCKEFRISRSPLWLFIKERTTPSQREMHRVAAAKRLSEMLEACPDRDGKIDLRYRLSKFLPTQPYWRRNTELIQAENHDTVDTT